MRPPNSTEHLLFSLGLNGAAAVSFRNRLINGNFSVNQRAAPTAPMAYPPGAFIRDRWRAGPSGCTAACVAAANGDTIIYIGKGTVRQHVEGVLNLAEGGTYCLSWQGDAIGRVIVAGNSPAFEVGPVVMPKLSQVADVIVELSHRIGGPPVSLCLAQLEPGSTPTVFERRDDEVTRCRRYFRRLAQPPLRGVISSPKLASRCGMALSPAMRVAPKATLVEPLSIYDGTSVCAADAILAAYSSTEIVELDLMLSSELSPGRPAISFVDQSGVLDLDAEMAE